MNIGPKQEPVMWSAIIGLIVAAFASYGFGITDELNELLVYVVPVIVAAFLARSQVFAPKTVAKLEAAAYVDGVEGDRPPTTR